MVKFNYYKKMHGELIHNKIDIESVIRQRLKLQSTQRELQHFGIFDNEFHYITRPTTLLAFEKWEVDKQKNFIRILGGPAFYNITFSYLNKLLRKVKGEVWQTNANEIDE